ncbi:MAG: ROK family protein [Anaerolineales bacterium]
MSGGSRPSRDLYAQEILRQAGALSPPAALVNLFNPLSMIIIGGGVAEAGDILTTPIRDALRERQCTPEQSVRIATAMLGRHSVLIGAIVQAINVAIHIAAEQRKYPVEIRARVEESLETNP